MTVDWHWLDPEIVEAVQSELRLWFVVGAVLGFVAGIAVMLQLRRLRVL